MTEHGGTQGQPTADSADGGENTSGAAGFDLGGSGAKPLQVEDPTWVGDIPLYGRLGSGGMGRVYLGLLDGEYAAVKQVHPHFAEDPVFLRRFGRELDNLGRLPADVSAPLLAGDREARPPWFATAYVPGLTLGEAVELSGGALPVPAVWRLLRHLAGGLREVHARRMVHRDLKPSNAMLTEDGVTLIDFGIARAAEQSQLTGTGMAVGTPAYMSPEQAAAAKDLTPATDVFALGSLVAYAVTGQPPFGEGAGHDVLYRIVHSEPDLVALREKDAEVADLVAACLDKEPAARPTTQELLDRAAEHAPGASPDWPAPVRNRLTARAAFVARPRPTHAPALPPLPPGTALVDEAPTQRAPEASPPEAPRPEAPRPEEKRRRRPRILLLVVPVVLAAGTTLTLQLLPDSSPATGAGGPRPSASASASAPAAPGSPHTASPTSSGTGSATPSGSRTPASGAPSASHPGAAAGATGEPKAPSATGGSTSKSSSTGGTGGSTTTGGGRSATTSGGSTSSAPPAASSTSPTGSHAYENGKTASCLRGYAFGNSVAVGSCSGDAAMWTLAPVSGGYHMVNKATHTCLQAGMFNNAATLAGCDSTSGLLTWSPRSGGGFADGSDGKCLYVAYIGGAPSGVGTATCDGSSAQAWRRR